MTVKPERPDGAPDCYGSFDIVFPARCGDCPFIDECEKLTRQIRFGKVESGTINGLNKNHTNNITS